MNFLYLMDPLETVIAEKDTTLALMVGAHKRGHKVFYLPKDGLTRTNEGTFFHVTQVIPQFDKGQCFTGHQELTLSEKDVDAVFIRTDPPFDGEYLYHTWLLDLIPERIAVINDPSGIRTTNEKIWATQFSSIVPPFMISRQRKDLLSFLEKYANVVAKPTDGHGGRSVFHLKHKERNANVTLETLTHHWKTDIILQQYIDQADDGDKRILLLNGDPLGAVLRVHSEDDHRNNFLTGGKALSTEITDNDLKIVEQIKPYVIAKGLYFVGIDILGDYLVEVNVTSPTCLQEMNRLYGLSLEDNVIAFAEKLIENKQSDVRIGT